MNFLCVRSFLFAVGPLFAVAPLFSQPVAPETETVMEEVVVRGRATDLVGIAGASSEGSVGRSELETRPFLRRGELLEVVPGVVITQHSGGGKANQYFLRGFNLDHGTDFSVAVEGMPVNLRSHGHGQGYADLNFIIPELVQRVDYGKGPYSVHVGDFSSAGAAEFQWVDRLRQSFVRAEAGENGYLRAVAGLTVPAGGKGALTLGLESLRDDGPWERPDDLRRTNGLVRWIWSDTHGSRASVTAHASRTTWNATDQVPARAIERGDIGRFGSLDTSNGGETERAGVSLEWVRRDPGAVTRARVYGFRYQLDLYSNFTLLLSDPVNGDQFNQRDRRWVWGGDVDRTWSRLLRERDFTVSVGLQLRQDRIDEVGLHQTTARRRLATVREDEVVEGSAAVYTRARWQIGPKVRMDAGVRADAYRFKVESSEPLNSGSRSATIASPKAGLVFGPWAKTEAYFNAGFGFHSNDARGTTIRVSPVTGEPADPVDPLVRSRGMEAGVRTTWRDGWISTVSVWSLDLDSELVFVGDAGETEPTGATRRYGVEWANFYRANDWLAFDADLSFTRARYRNAPGADRIANSIGTVVTAGVVLGRATEGAFGVLRLRSFGEQPLTEDNRIVQPASTTLNARLGWRWRQWEVAVDVLNLLDRAQADIAYAYTSRLSGEPDEGVEDVHLHPAEPRTFRFSVSRAF